jgi:hypothetical protein
MCPYVIVAAQHNTLRLHSQGPIRKGQSGNPGGSSQARKLLNDSFLRALHRVWDMHGETALERLAQEHPSQFVTNMFK